MSRWLRITLVSLLALAALLGGLWMWLDEPRPSGEPGPAADALARKVAAAVNDEAWARTGAVRWNFDDRHRLLWDRQRDLVAVRWDQTRVLRRVGDARGALAFEGDEPLSGEARERAVKKAYALWANDSFWLNPLEKLFDRGVTRSVWTGPDGEKGLIVHYASGGVTPGDTYLWLLGKDGRPRAWRMWVQIIPIGGLQITWEGWKTLATGAWVSTLHRLGPIPLELRIKDVEGAATLEDLTGGVDPFAELVAEGASALQWAPWTLHPSSSASITST